MVSSNKHAHGGGRWPALNGSRISVFLLIAALLAVMSAGVGNQPAQAQASPQDEDNGTPLGPHDFELAAEQGFGDRHNSVAWSMSWYKDKLYVGTNRAWLCWSFASFEQLAPALEYLYPPRESDVECTEEQEDLPLRAEIWSWDPSTDEWDRVYQSPEVVTLPDNPDKQIAREIAFRTMGVFEEEDGTEALYVGSTNARSFLGEDLPPPTILRTTDGENFEPIPQEPGTVLGDLEKASFRGMTIFDGRLHVLHSSVQGNGRLYASANPSEGNDAWQRVSPSEEDGLEELRFFDLHPYNEHLYAATVSSGEGYGVMKTDGVEGDDGLYDFTHVVESGAHLHGQASAYAISMEEFKGDLYVGTVRPSEMVRIHPDDTWDLIMGTPRRTPDGEMKRPVTGWADSFNHALNEHIWRMQVHDGHMYVGTFDNSTSQRSCDPNREVLEDDMGFDLYRTSDGVNYESITHNGFGDKFDFGVRTFQSTPHGLFVGTANYYHGGKVYLGVDDPSADSELTAPGHVVGSATSTGIDLSWEEEPGADQYRVSRAPLTNIDVIVPGGFLPDEFPWDGCGIGVGDDPESGGDESPAAIARALVGAADEQTLDQAAGILSASPEGAAGAAAEQVERKLVEILSDNPALLRQAQSAMEVSQEPPLRLLLLLLLLSELPDGTVIPTPRMERVADVHTEIGVTSGTSFTDETAEPGTFYSYHVVAEDTESGETTTSQVVAASASTRSNLATSPLTDTAISPDAQTVDAGGTVEYEARTTDWRQEVMPEMDFDWSLTDPDAGTLTKTGTSTAKLVASTVAGEYPDAIVAEAQGERHTASVTIKPGPLTSLSISPSDPTVPVSGTVEFDAAGSDAFGNPISDPGAEWSVTDSDAGTIDPETGLFTAGTTPGTYTDAISAAAKGVVETTSVTVQASDPPVASFEVDWEDLDSDGDIDVGEQVTFTDTSAGSPTSWEWDLDGDGTTDSTAQNPSFSYEAADSYTVTLTVANSQGSDSASSTIEVVPGAFQAVPGMSIGMGDDQKPYVEVSAEDTLDRATGEHIDLDGGIGGYQACVTYNPELIQVKDVQGVPSFEVTEPEIDNSSGEACFGGDSTDGGTQAPAGLARLHIRLVGPEVGFGEEEPSLELAGSSFRLFESATGEGGIADDDIAKEFGRGDARADGTPDIADAMFIAQTLADLRPVGESVTDSTHAVNAASVRTDGSVDVLNIADAMFIAQRLAGLRDELYE